MSRFYDSNIFIYAYSDEPKSKVAQALIAEPNVIGVQVLNEVANVMRGKMRRHWDEIERRLQDMEHIASRVMPLTLAIQQAGIGLAKDHSIPIYDAMMIATALEAGCDELISEDMQHGRRFERLTDPQSVSGGLERPGFCPLIPSDES